MKNFILAVLFSIILTQTAYASTMESSELFISPEAVFKNKQQYMLIDIRNSTKFELTHIPDSINLSASSINKKKYLQTKNIILVNQGYSSSAILKRCVKLKKDGFNVLILKGGINSWAMKELPLSNTKNIFSVFEITPLELYKSLNSTSWLAINISETPVKNKYLSDLKTITFPKSSISANEKELLNSIYKKIENRKLLIYDKYGSGYSSLLKALKNQKETPNNLFFLKGGINQFNFFTKRVLRFPIARKVLSSEDDCDCD